MQHRAQYSYFNHARFAICRGLKITVCGNKDSIFFALDPKLVSKTGNLRFGNSKIRKTG
jgi:hypothetical protein